MRRHQSITGRRVLRRVRCEIHSATDQTPFSRIPVEVRVMLLTFLDNETLVVARTAFGRALYRAAIASLTYARDCRARVRALCHYYPPAKSCVLQSHCTSVWKKADWPTRLARVVSSPPRLGKCYAALVGDVVAARHGNVAILGSAMRLFDSCCLWGPPKVCVDLGPCHPKEPIAIWGPNHIQSTAVWGETRVDRCTSYDTFERVRTFKEYCDISVVDDDTDWRFFCSPYGRRSVALVNIEHNREIWTSHSLRFPMAMGTNHCIVFDLLHSNVVLMDIRGHKTNLVVRREQDQGMFQMMQTPVATWDKRILITTEVDVSVIDITMPCRDLASLHRGRSHLTYAMDGRCIVMTQSTVFNGSSPQQIGLHITDSYLKEIPGTLTVWSEYEMGARLAPVFINPSSLAVGDRLFRM